MPEENEPFQKIITDLQDQNATPGNDIEEGKVDYKTLLKSLMHCVIGGVAAWALAHLGVLTAHLDPITGAVIGSVISSLASAFSKQPNK